MLGTAGADHTLRITAQSGKVRHSELAWGGWVIVTTECIANSQGNTWAMGRFVSQNRLEPHRISLLHTTPGTSSAAILKLIVHSSAEEPMNIINEPIPASAKVRQPQPWCGWLAQPGQEPWQHAPLARRAALPSLGPDETLNATELKASRTHVALATGRFGSKVATANGLRANKARVNWLLGDIHVHREYKFVMTNTRAAIPLARGV